MADPISAVGLAAAIAQFLDVGFRFIAAAQEIYDSSSGTRQDIAELRMVVQDIKHLNRKDLADLSYTQPLSADDRAILSLAGECDALADALLDEMAPLELRHNARNRVLGSMRVSISTLLRRRDITRLWKRLSLMERELRERVSRAVQREQYSSIVLLLDRIRWGGECAEYADGSKPVDFPHAIAHAAVSDGSGKENAYAITLQELQSSLTDLVREGRLADQRQAVVQSLTFQAMVKRHSQIETAHFDTLDWVLARGKTSLLEWLEGQDGIYWVSGLAGSGKSTLMKYLSSHPTTKEALHRWVSGERLFVAHFYFWNAGVDMQKSQLGLLQSMLYQILRFDPALVDRVCPDHHGSAPWDIAELKLAFAQLVDAAPSARFCFFIDGLDEYDGSEWEIISVLQHLAQSDKIKICASSRPWAAFEKALGSPGRTLVMQDHTMKDMRNYVEHTLLNNDTFRDLAAKDDRYYRLVEEITKRSSGVWLWVFLVVRDLLRDINTRETYNTLVARLRSLPQELSQYFARILSRIDPFFRKDTARIFSIIVESVHPLRLYGLTYLEKEIHDPQYAIHAEVRATNPQAIATACADWRLQLQSRCGDLLVVCSEETGDEFSKHTVDFLHRTVREFLQDNQHTILRSTAPSHSISSSSSKQTLCSMLLALLKSYPVNNTFQQSSDALFALVDELLYYAYELEQQCQTTPWHFGLLDEVDRVMSTHSQDLREHWTNRRTSTTTNAQNAQALEKGHCSYLGLAIQARLRLYVEHVLDRPSLSLSSSQTKKSKVKKKKGRPLLDYALRPTCLPPNSLPYHFGQQQQNQQEGGGTSRTIEVPLVSSLLSRGCDPNEITPIYRTRTTWELFVLFAPAPASSLREHDNDNDNDDTYSAANEAFFEAACLMVEYGADMDRVVRLPVLQSPFWGGYSSGRGKDVPGTTEQDRDQASAREILSGVLSARQMVVLEGKARKARLLGLGQRVGWLEWVRLFVGQSGGRLAWV